MINVYDFDGTIYDGDSSVDFYLYCLKRKPSIIFLFPIQIFGIVMYKLKLKNKEYAKGKFFCFLKKIKNIDDYVKDFWKKKKYKIKKWYLNQKDKTDVIISASPEFLLKPLKKELGVNTIIASKVNKKTGVFESKNCYGQEKIVRFEKEFNGKKSVECFYSDSFKADKPMMEYAKDAYLVNGDKIERVYIDGL